MLRGDVEWEREAGGIQKDYNFLIQDNPKNVGQLNTHRHLDCHWRACSCEIPPHPPPYR